VQAFLVGAADADITPPALDTPLGQRLDTTEFVPGCAPSATQLRQLWPGRRSFAFEDPYIDVSHVGAYVPGDPYCDPTAAHRYQAPYIAGGSGANHWPITSADDSTNTPTTRMHNPNATDDPIQAHAVVFVIGHRHVAMVTVDSIGIFNATMNQVRAAVAAEDPNLAPASSIFISSTHDESAPDPIGLWGPDLSGEPSPVNQANSALPVGVSSGVDEYYMHFLVQRVAAAIRRADRSAQPARLRVAISRMPANTQPCWSSYPFIDTDLVPVLQGVTPRGHVIFTLVNVGTHDESLAFSGNPTYTSMLSGDWTGRLAKVLEANYPGSVGMEMAGLVGSVETPALYPTGTIVRLVPRAFHDVPGKPVDGCSSVYPEPRAAPYTDALAFNNAYASSVARTALTSLRQATTFVPRQVEAQTTRLCLPLENNFFVAAFAAGLFPDRPAFTDPTCRVGVTFGGSVAAGASSQPARTGLGPPTYIQTEVGVLTVGPVQIAYSPGEVFPFTEVGGPVDPAHMPFPTDCYRPSPNDPTNPSAGSYACGAALPMTPFVSARMTRPFRFLAGLGEDMIGYLFPPGNFVGSSGETLEPPWSSYEDTAGTGHDRFGYGHADDSESVGPHAGLVVTQALARLLRRDGQGTRVLPGLFVDRAGRLCDSPFPGAGSWVTGCARFTGAIGIRVLEPSHALRTIAVGPDVRWATYLATPDHGTAGTGYAYSTATRGVLIDGTPLLMDTFTGAIRLAGR
jgi:hypothetical protein